MKKAIKYNNQVSTARSMGGNTTSGEDLFMMCNCPDAACYLCANFQDIILIMSSHTAKVLKRIKKNKELQDLITITTVTPNVLVILNTQQIHMCYSDNLAGSLKNHPSSLMIRLQNA